MPSVMRVSLAEKQRTKAEEGLRLDAYADTQEPPHWTIAWGHADTNPRPVIGVLDGRPYKGPPVAGLVIHLSEAERLFDEDADEIERQISAELGEVALTQGQMDALFSFTYQYGINKLHASGLLSQIEKNPFNHQAILPEFARWNVNAGVHDKAIYMRSCRRACVYAGVTIPQVLYEPKTFPWPKTNAQKIDYTQTPDVHKLVALGKRVSTAPKFPPASPVAAPPVAPEPLPAPTLADETLPPSQEDTGPGIAIPALEPTPVEASPLPPGEEKPQASPPKAQAPAATPSVGTKPIDPDTKQAHEVPYGVDPTAGAKPLERSSRFIGSAIMLFATVLRSIMSKARYIGGATGTLATGFLALYDNPETRPVLIGAATVAMGVVAATSFGVWAAVAAHKKGLAIKRKAEAEAQQLLY